MARGSTDGSTDRGPLVHRAAALLLVLALAALGASSRAGVRPRVSNPHGAFHEECGLCHGARGWRPARISRRFDHAKYGFPLAGAHAAAGCLDCHASLEFGKTDQRCAACHEDPHRGEMGTDCARCHGSRSFIDRTAMLRAHQLTRFPLTGGHAGLDCEVCHRPVAQGRMQFVATQAECQSCHLDDYRGARSPDHTASGFPLECQSCHTPLGWHAAAFDHSRTRFPLTGAHLAAAACQDCHGDQVYAGKSTACASCHQAAYNHTTNPDHAAAGFPTTCQICHTTIAWQGASFDHSTTGFPLTGAHLNAQCQDCHGDGVYAGRSTACASCHQANYNHTTDPNHTAAGFPTTCQNCHTTTNWIGRFTEHDASYFPIYSGTHKGRWSACSTCHVTNTNYAVFTCFACHPHDDKTITDSRHAAVSGYTYDSQACYSCHPRGTH